MALWEGKLLTGPEHFIEDVQEKKLLDDVLVTILKLLRRDCGESFFQCMQVSRQWRRVAQSAVSTITWTCGTIPLEAALQMAHFENLRTIVMERCLLGKCKWPFIFKCLGLNCPYLSSLSMLYVQPLVKTKDLVSLLASCRALTTARFYRCIHPRANLPDEHMASLLHLHVDFSSELGDFSRLLGFGHLKRRDFQPITTLHCLARLTTLHLLHLYDARLPSLENIASLRQLRLEGNYLNTLPSLTHLTHLETLDLSSSYELTSLVSLDLLPSLQSLGLKGVGVVAIRPSTACLTQLRSLNLSNVDRPVEMERFAVALHPFTALRCLESLTLGIHSQARASCAREWLPQLTALKDLSLSITASLNIPVLCLPSGLQTLHISNTRSSVIDLRVEGPTALRSLTTCSGVIYPEGVIASLQKLNVLSAGDKHEWFPSFSSLVNLRDFRFRINGPPNHCIKWEDIDSCPSLDGPSQLEAFRLTMPSLRHLGNSLFARLGCLRSLDIQMCYRLQSLPPLDTLPLLEEFSLWHLPALTQLPALHGLTRLRKLLLYSCLKIVELPPLEGLRELQELWLHECVKLTRLAPLSGLTSLCILSLEDCRALRELPALHGLPRLRLLNFKGCKALGRRPCDRFAKDLDITQPEARFYHCSGNEYKRLSRAWAKDT